jgi:hypothetical protein
VLPLMVRFNLGMKKGQTSPKSENLTRLIA